MKDDETARKGGAGSAVAEPKERPAPVSPPPPPAPPEREPESGVSLETRFSRIEATLADLREKIENEENPATRARMERIETDMKNTIERLKATLQPPAGEKTKPQPRRHTLTWFEREWWNR